MKFESDKKAIWSWCLYDWANSAFALTVMAAFFPAFFNKYWSTDVESAIVTFRLGMGNTAAGLCVALLSPVLGAIAGTGKSKKQFLVTFICLGVLMTSGLFFVGQGRWLLAIFVYILARIGFSIANLFYDAFLIDVAKPKDRDMVSSLGFALGYLGCGLLFVLNILMYRNPSFFGIRDSVFAVRLAFLSASAWWLIFSIPVMLFVHEKKKAEIRGVSQIIIRGMSKLRQTAAAILQNKNLCAFLIAYWFYIDGVHTVVMMAEDFGISLGIPVGTLMIALLFVQLIAFPSALFFGLLSRTIGAKRIILISIGIYVIISIGGAWILHTGMHFIFFASLTGLVQGSIQALSRSFYATLIPEGRESEFFGFYNMIGRFALIIGPAIVGLANLLVHVIGLREETASRWGISSLAVLFIIGGILLLKVKVPAEEN